MMVDVDPKLRVLLDMMAALGAPPLRETTPQQFRDMRAKSRDLLNAPTAPLAVVKDEIVAGGDVPIKARIYDVEEGDARPTLVYFHGGGFIFGDLESHDGLCRRLALAGCMRVIAVDYRLAPEHPFPAAQDDAWAAIQDVIARRRHFGVDIARVAVGGDSAGANLAAVAARRAARGGAPALQCQLLFYPITQAVHSTPSRERFSEGYFLTRETIDWFDGHYLPPTVDRRDERISPLLTPPPQGLAPALVVTAGFDPLVDEGRDYAKSLNDAGIPCAYVDYPDQIHGFASFTAFSTVADAAIAAAARHVRETLG